MLNSAGGPRICHSWLPLSGLHAADHNPLSLAVWTVASQPYCPHFICLSVRMPGETRVKVFANAETNNIRSSPLIHWYSHVTGESHQVGQTWFPLHKLMLNIANHLLVLHIFWNGLQDYLLHQGDADWLFLPFLKIRLTFASSSPREPSPITTTFQQIMKSGLAVTPASSLSTHGDSPSGPTDKSMSSLF